MYECAGHEIGKNTNKINSESCVETKKNQITHPAGGYKYPHGCWHCRAFSSTISIPECNRRRRRRLRSFVWFGSVGPTKESVGVIEIFRPV